MPLAPQIRVLARFSALLVGLVGCSLAAAAQNEVGKWSEQGETSFGGGHCGCVATDGRHFYVLRQHSSEKTANFVRFELGKEGLGAEERLDSPPVHGRTGASLAWDGEIYIYFLIGGSYGAPANERTSFLRYSISAGQWEELADTPLPQGAGDALAVVRREEKTRVFALLGCAHGQDKRKTCDGSAFGEYDPTKNEWKTIDAKPWGCTDDGTSLAWNGDRFLYATRGSDCRDKSTTSFSRFDLDSRRWEEQAQTPSPPDDGGSLAFHAGALYLATGGGGEDGKEPAEGRGFFRFDSENNKWETLTSLPGGIGNWTGNRLAVVGDHIYCWQGSPMSWTDEGGGKRIWRYRIK